MPPDPDRGLRFDPTDPADLETFRAELSARTGRAFVIPPPFEVPIDAVDPTAADGWTTYPEDPCVRHYERATRTTIDLSFPGDDRFKVFGWVWEGSPAGCRTIGRTGRFHRCGAAELADGLAALLYRLLTGDR